MIRTLTTFILRRYRNICNLFRDFMQIRIRHLYIAAPETVQRATHTFAIHVKRICVEHSNVLKLRPRQRLTNGEHARESLLMALNIRV